jgi:hypothetical protein
MKHLASFLEIQPTFLFKHERGGGNMSREMEVIFIENILEPEGEGSSGRSGPPPVGKPSKRIKNNNDST